ncbi:MAG TPA: PAS domain S-box protein, partial [Albitalea sp.]|nr:PAS domain S-box protein [Albitalea sp.]
MPATCIEAGTLVGANGLFLRMLGLAKDVLIGRDLADLELDAAPPRSTHDSDGSATWATRVRCADGRWLPCSVASRWDEQMQQALWLWTPLAAATPESANRQTRDRKLRSLMAEKRLILDCTPLGILKVDAQRRILDANKTFCEMFGRPRKDIVGQTSRVIFDSDEQYQEVGRSVYPTVFGADRFSLDFKTHRADGSPFWVHTVGRAIERGNPGEGTVWIYEDVTERKTLQESFDKHLAETKVLLKNLQVGVVLVGGRKILRVNERMLSMLGCEEADLLEGSARDFFESDDAYKQVMSEAMSRLAQGHTYCTEKPLVTKRGDR